MGKMLIPLLTLVYLFGVLENEQTLLGTTTGEVVPCMDNLVSTKVGSRWRVLWENGLEGDGICKDIGWGRHAWVKRGNRVREKRNGLYLGQ